MQLENKMSLQVWIDGFEKNIKNLQASSSSSPIADMYNRYALAAYLDVINIIKPLLKNPSKFVKLIKENSKETKALNEAFTKVCSVRFVPRIFHLVFDTEKNRFFMRADETSYQFAKLVEQALNDLNTNVDGTLIELVKSNLGHQLEKISHSVKSRIYRKEFNKHYDRVDTEYRTKILPIVMNHCDAFLKVADLKQIEAEIPEKMKSFLDNCFAALKTYQALIKNNSDLPIAYPLFLRDDPLVMMNKVIGKPEKQVFQIKHLTLETNRDQYFQHLKTYFKVIEYVKNELSVHFTNGKITTKNDKAPDYKLIRQRCFETLRSIMDYFYIDENYSIKSFDHLKEKPDIAKTLCQLLNIKDFPVEQWSDDNHLQQFANKLLSFLNYFSSEAAIETYYTELDARSVTPGRHLVTQIKEVFYKLHQFYNTDNKVVFHQKSPQLQALKPIVKNHHPNLANEIDHLCHLVEEIDKEYETTKEQQLGKGHELSTWCESIAKQYLSTVSHFSKYAKFSPAAKHLLMSKDEISKNTICHECYNELHSRLYMVLSHSNLTPWAKKYIMQHAVESLNSTLTVYLKRLESVKNNKADAELKQLEALRDVINTNPFQKTNEETPGNDGMLEISLN